MEHLPLAGLFSIVVINTIVPGPIIVLICSRVVQVGVLAGIHIILGVLIADLISLTITWSILTYALAFSEQIYRTMKMVGAVILLVMAIWMLMQSNPRGKKAPQSKLQDWSVHDMFLGLILGLACPFTIVFMLSVLPQLVPTTSITVSGGLLVAATITTATAIPLFGIVLTASGVRKTIPKSGQWMQRAGALSLVVFAIVGLAGPA